MDFAHTGIIVFGSDRSISVCAWTLYACIILNSVRCIMDVQMDFYMH